jgi:hypothetical protein
MGKVGKSVYERTFAGARGNDEDSPKPVVRWSSPSPARVLLSLDYLETVIT